MPNTSWAFFGIENEETKAKARNLLLNRKAMQKKRKHSSNLNSMQGRKHATISIAQLFIYFGIK